MKRILSFNEFNKDAETETNPGLEAGKITTHEDLNGADDENTDRKRTPKSASSTTGAISGDSEVKSPTSTRTEVRSPTSTETSTDAYTSGNITVTGGAGAGATTVIINKDPEDYKRLASGAGRKEHMPSAIAMEGPNDPKSY